MILRALASTTRCVVAAGILTSFALCSTAGIAAQTPKLKAANLPAAQVIVQLKSIRKLLQGANHDYEGHRAKAVHEVTKAIHLLEGTPLPKAQKLAKTNVAGGGNGGAGVGGVHEAQAASDMQLKQALTGLQTLQTHFNGSTAGVNGDVNTAITTAVSELETALKIR
jgi:hypothetical protein